MKLSESWLREWINPPLTTQALGDALTFAGISVEEIMIDGTDNIFSFELTPNRGDCLSVLGIAREISALTSTLMPATMQHPLEVVSNSLTITNQASVACPHYEAMQIAGITSDATTPLLIQQRLQQSGLACIHPIVDILNYVMLEIGQPLHAFDVAPIQQGIIIRYAKPDECLTLLDGRTITLTPDSLVISDHQQVLALAGIMGGLASSVTSNTTTVLIESAHFTPNAIAGRARYYGLHTEASHRFERGVDPQLPLQALARVLALCQTIYPTLTYNWLAVPPSAPAEINKIDLALDEVDKILGMKIAIDTIENILQRLNMKIQAKYTRYWQVKPPSYRFDITESIDLVEEIIRIHGYAHIPLKAIIPQLSLTPFQDKISPLRLKHLLVAQGFQEIITYSFIDENWQQACDPEQIPWKLTNPISIHLQVMRTNLWAGLLQTAQYNLNRQQASLQLFETGLRFRGNQQETMLSGLWAGKRYPEQWSEPLRDVDFFDGKALLENCWQLQRHTAGLTWQTSTHPALHPGQSAALYWQDQCLGECGMLHPQLQQKFGLTLPIFLFEIKLDVFKQNVLPSAQAISKYPAIRQDIAVIIEQNLAFDAIKQSIMALAESALQEIRLFDVYQGNNLLSNQKSIGLGLIFQRMDRTLRDEEIHQSVARIVQQLVNYHQAVLRE